MKHSKAESLSIYLGALYNDFARSIALIKKFELTKQHLNAPAGESNASNQRLSPMIQTTMHMWQVSMKSLQDTYLYNSGGCYMKGIPF